jgi:hypothetical protein
VSVTKEIAVSNGPVPCPQPITDESWSLDDLGHVALRAAKIREKLRSAARTTPEAYGGKPVVWEDQPVHVGDDSEQGNGYHHSLASLRSRAEYAGVPLPAWVWACSPMRLAIDARDLIQRELECEYPESAYDQIEEPLLDELQTCLDAWTSRLPCLGWQEDDSAVVVLDPAAFEALVSEQKEQG